MLKNFNSTLKKYRKELGESRYWRYTQAEDYPNIIEFIAARPDLAASLAIDALEKATSNQGETNDRSNTARGTIDVAG